MAAKPSTPSPDETPPKLRLSTGDTPRPVDDAAEIDAELDGILASRAAAEAAAAAPPATTEPAPAAAPEEAAAAAPVKTETPATRASLSTPPPFLDENDIDFNAIDEITVEPQSTPGGASNDVDLDAMIAEAERERARQAAAAKDASIREVKLGIHQFAGDEEDPAPTTPAPAPAAAAPAPSTVKRPTAEMMAAVIPNAQQRDHEMDEDEKLEKITELLKKEGMLAGVVEYAAGAYNIELPEDAIKANRLARYGIGSAAMQKAPDEEQSGLNRWYVPAKLLQGLTIPLKDAPAPTDDDLLKVLKETKGDGFTLARLTRLDDNRYAIDGVDADVKPESVFPGMTKEDPVNVFPIYTMRIPETLMDAALMADVPAPPSPVLPERTPPSAPTAASIDAEEIKKLYHAAAVKHKEATEKKSGRTLIDLPRPVLAAMLKDKEKVALLLPSGAAKTESWIVNAADMETLVPKDADPKTLATSLQHLPPLKSSVVIRSKDGGHYIVSNIPLGTSRSALFADEKKNAVRHGPSCRVTVPDALMQKILDAARAKPAAAEQPPAPATEDAAPAAPAPDAAPTEKPVSVAKPADAIAPRPPVARAKPPLSKTYSPAAFLQLIRNTDYGCAGKFQAADDNTPGIAKGISVLVFDTYDKDEGVGRTLRKLGFTEDQIKTFPTERIPKGEFRITEDWKTRVFIPEEEAKKAYANYLEQHAPAVAAS